ncbi:hypothetical protein BGW37DRAFT_482287 [Umbelopsis sp. PMI_123]|nr:hypothetical protein BGW37DRAFT_482287 [Umbelopsis sp. PMI_123]
MSTTEKKVTHPSQNDSSSSSNAENEPSFSVDKTLQLVWFAGHTVTIVGTILYLLSVVLFRSNRLFYVLAYLGTITSYAVIVYRAFGLPKEHQPYLSRLLIDENAIYMFLAMYWIITKPITITLAPYVIYSALHIAEYARVHLLHQKPETQRMLKEQNEKHYSRAMLLAAEVEVYGVMGRLILGAITFQSSAFSALLFAHFLRLRYHMSENTRTAFTNISNRLDKLLLPPQGNKKIPPVVQKVYNKTKVLLTRYGGSPIRRKAM